MQNERNLKETPDGTKLWLVMMKAHNAIQAYAEFTIAATGLGITDFMVLEILLHKGTMAVNELGPKVFLTPGSISVAVERLVVQGLVTRSEDARDRRVRRVDLTPKGRKLIETAFGQHAAHMNTLGEVLEPKERRTLLEYLKMLGKAAEKLSESRQQG